MVEKEDEKEYWNIETISFLGISQIEGIGYWTLFRLSQKGKSFQQILASKSKEEFYSILESVEYRKKLSFFNWETAKRTIWQNGNKMYQMLQKQNVQTIFDGQVNFPQSLKTISDYPRWLFYQGNLEILNTPSIAIVGTRKPSQDGLFFVHYLGGLFPKFQKVIVSGLANGIDQAVHNMCLRLKVPTVAFLGTGIFSDYPQNTQTMRASICQQGGAIVTEYLPNQKYSKQNFVRRNRLQAAAAQSVIPVEWRIHGGTDHTVDFALKYNRNVIGLRFPDWEDKNHPELAKIIQSGGIVFSIPGEETQLCDYILKNRNKIQSNKQLSFFD